MACGALLYGTCTTSIFATDLSSSPDRWLDVPLPNEPKFSFPGLAFAKAISSRADFAGSSGLTTSRLGTDAVRVMGLKSLTAS